MKRLLCMLLLCAGCGDDDTTPPGTPDAATTDAGSGDAGRSDAGGDTQPLFGEFAFKFIATVPATATRAEKPPTTSVIGKLTNAATQSMIVWELADSADGCELRTPRVPFCDPGCGGTATCVEDDQCVDNPVAQDIGTVSVRGIGPMPFDMKLISDNYQYTQSSSWAYPACDEGDTVEVHSARGRFDALDLRATCIAPLEVSGDVAIEDGKPVALRWTPPGKSGQSRMQIELDISHHGGAKGLIQCDVADTGEFAVPATLVDQLVALGVAGFPTVAMSRVSTGTGMTPNTKDVSLSISATVSRAIEIAGLVSCDDDSQCDDGQTCQADATCK